MFGDTANGYLFILFMITMLPDMKSEEPTTLPIATTMMPAIRNEKLREATTARICHLPNCPLTSCPEGYSLVYDKNECACPTCQPAPTTCPPKSCPLIKECQNGYKLVSTDCECPVCEKANVSSTTPVECDPPFCPKLDCGSGKIVYDPTRCSCPKCEKSPSYQCKERDFVCPKIVCEEGYDVIYDPTGCKCPACGCIPRPCPTIARICDSSNPPPTPLPCECPTNCIYLV